MLQATFPIDEFYRIFIFSTEPLLLLILYFVLLRETPNARPEPRRQPQLGTARQGASAYLPTPEERKYFHYISPFPGVSPRWSLQLELKCDCALLQVF